MAFIHVFGNLSAPTRPAHRLHRLAGDDTCRATAEGHVRPVASNWIGCKSGHFGTICGAARW